MAASLGRGDGLAKELNRDLAKDFFKIRTLDSSRKTASGYETHILTSKQNHHMFWSNTMRICLS